MAREIRITVDDDEVFERMKRRKRELDLSWREVLHRGLWDDQGTGVQFEGQPGEGRYQYGRPGEDMGDRLERQIKQRVEDSLQRALGLEEAQRRSRPAGAGYDDEMESLASAENALLAFPFLADDHTYRVPLRVELEMRAGDVRVEVVTVRQGKSVEGMNAFDRAARKRIAEEMAAGTPVTLELGDGVETYRVTPVLTWSRDDRGEPTVADVEIDDVLLGES